MPAGKTQEDSNEQTRHLLNLIWKKPPIGYRFSFTRFSRVRSDSARARGQEGLGIKLASLLISCSGQSLWLLY